MPPQFTHTNLIAKDWKRLAVFYQDVFDCKPIPPERDLSGGWLDKATGIQKAQISGIHLRLPGYGMDGPTLEIFQYNVMPGHPNNQANTPGFSHIAFAVDDVAITAQAILQAGGSELGALTIQEIPNVGLITFQYLRDPEGNIIEVQSWERFATQE